MAVLRLTAQEDNFVRSLANATGAVGRLAGTMNAQLSRSFQEADYVSRNFARGIDRQAESFKSFGRAASIGVTLPLILLSKSASDAYAELDSLKRGLMTLEPTAEKLSERLAMLRGIARSPGIGFQEAIQGDVRLRSVGISAEKSTKILKEFSNAIATTGGGKAQLGEVTVQLGQMAAKGKVLAQDLRPIIEAAPSVATAMKKIFGTVDSESISKSLEAKGKNSTDFINMLLAELEKAPRVTGGWKNALENMNDTLFISQARIFGVADKIFDLSSKMSVVEKFIESAVDAFESMDEPTQKLIVGFVILAGTVGPLAIGFGFLQIAMARLTTSMGLAAVQRAAFTAGIVAAVAVVAVLAMETSQLNREMENNTQTTERAKAAIIGEYTVMKAQVDVYNNAKSSLEAKTRAKEELIKINPAFEKVLLGEKTNMTALNNVVQQTTNSYLTLAKIKIKQKQIDDLTQRAQDLNGGKLPMGTEMAVGLVDLFSSRDVRGETIERNKRNVANQLNTLAEEMVGLQSQIVVKKEAALETDLKSLTINESAVNQAKKINDEFEKSQQRVLEGILETNVAENEALKTSTEKLSVHNREVEAYAKKRRMREDEKEDDKKKAVGNKLDEISEGYAREKEKIKAINKEVTDMMTDVGVDIVTGLLSGEGLNGAMKRGLSAFGSFAIELGKKALGITTLLKGLMANPTTGKALSLIAGGIALKAISSSIKVPALAQGGMVTNPMLAMIGDNSSGKEMVLPFEKTGEFADMISKSMGGQKGADSEISVRTLIRGEDLELLLERRKRAK